jgi:cytochrome P450
MAILRTSSSRLALVPSASAADTARTVAEVLLPLLGRGLIVRRPAVVSAAERLDLDRRAVRQLQYLRHRYGSGPLRLRIPGRRLALILEPEHVHRVLGQSPEPFAAANLEKQHALGQFQPDGVLVSEGAERAERRRFNESVLDTPSPVHELAGSFVAKIREEAAALLAAVDEGGGSHAAAGTLDWDTFLVGWYRAVRRIVLGDGARDDHELTDLLGSLRAKANWSFLRPTDRSERERFLQRLQDHVARAEPGSLAAMMAATATTSVTEPVQQVPQWLFAYEPAGMATFRALALLDAHPDWAHTARDEMRQWDLTEPQELPALVSTVLESLRLWPTTPGILRDTTADTVWDRGVLPAGTGVLIHAPFFHRDDQRLAEADRFAPELWDGRRPARDWPLVPFSDGPVVCPGRNLVLLTTSTMLAALLEHHDLALSDPDRVDPTGPLPSVLDPFTLQFDVRRRVPGR